jgi:hypothetical protein
MTLRIEMNPKADMRVRGMIMLWALNAWGDWKVKAAGIGAMRSQAKSSFRLFEFVSDTWL